MKPIKNCLMIDDDVDDQELFEIALSSLDPQIICKMANNGLEGLNHLKSNPLPDIIFLDLNMPKMNGKECLKAIKADPAFQNIPVIILSTSINPTDRSETLALGATQFITKPSSTSELTQLLSELLNSLPKPQINNQD
jgi:CheY-like chemotaxis protein